MIMIELVTPVIFGSTSMLIEGTDETGVLGEIQPIYIILERVSNKNRAGRATVFKQMIPYVRLKDLLKDEATSLILCFKNMPTEIYANTLSGACVHAARKWLTDTMHFDPDKYTQLPDAMWRYPP